MYGACVFSCNLPPAFWMQNDQDLLRVAAVSRGWNEYRNKMQHIKLTMENKILPQLQQVLKPATF